MTRVRSNALAMGGAFLVQAVFVFLQIKILTHWLTPTQVGLFSSVFALGALLGSLAELGFSVVLIRYGAKFEAEGRPDQVLELLKLAVGLWLVAGVALGGLLLLLAGRVADGLHQPELTASLLALGFFSVLSFSLRAFASASFQGSRRMTPSLLIELVYMAGVTLSYALVGPRMSVAAVFWSLMGWSVVVGIGGLVSFVLSVRKESRSVAVGASGSPAPTKGFALLREIKTFWGGALITTALAIAFENADRLVLASLLPLEAVGAYHLAGRINLFTRKILFVPQQVTKPEVAFKWERGDLEPLRRDLMLFSKLELAVGVLLSVGVVLFARAGVVLASDSRYLAAEPVLVAMAGAIPILAIQTPLTTFLRASGRIWISVRSETIWLLSSLGVGVLLMKRFGLPGFAMGQMIAAFLSLLFTVWTLRRLRLPCPSLTFLLGYGGAAIALWGAAALFTRWHPIVSPLWALGAALLFAVLLNVALSRFHFLSDREESRLFGLLGSGPWTRVGRAVLAWPRGGRASA